MYTCTRETVSPRGGEKTPVLRKEAAALDGVSALNWAAPARLSYARNSAPFGIPETAKQVRN